jgi:hypothetical protein
MNTIDIRKVKMEEIIDSFRTQCQVARPLPLNIEYFVHQFHQYLLSKGYEINYRINLQRCLENPLEFSRIIARTGLSPWMLEEWFWIYFHWTMKHYHGLDIGAEWSPAAQANRSMTQEEFYFMAQSLPGMIHFLWELEEEQILLPEEFHSLQTFCDEYLEFWAHHIYYSEDE